MTMDSVADHFAEFFHGFRLREDRRSRRLGGKAAFGSFFDLKNDFCHGVRSAVEVIGKIPSIVPFF